MSYGESENLFAHNDPIKRTLVLHIRKECVRDVSFELPDPEFTENYVEILISHRDVYRALIPALQPEINKMKSKIKEKLRVFVKMLEVILDD